MTAKEIKAMSEWVDMMKVMLDACNDRMEAELAEPEKPKLELRHGDYGWWKSGGAWAALSRNGKFEAFGSEKGSGMPASKMDPQKLIQVGNIFDELEVLSEDVEEFTFGEGLGKNTCRRDAYRVVITPEKPGSVIIHADDLSAYVLKLRQMAATAARKSGKQE